MKKNTADFTDKIINEIKRIVSKPYWAVGENISFILSKDILPDEGRFKILFVITASLVRYSEFGEVDLTKLYISDEKIIRGFRKLFITGQKDKILILLKYI